MTLLWRRAEDDGGEEITRYDAEMCIVPNMKFNPVPTGDFSLLRNDGQKEAGTVVARVGGLQPETDVRIRVRAVNKHGGGEWSEHVELGTGMPPVPDAPTEITVETDGSGIHWYVVYVEELFVRSPIHGI